MVFLLHAAAIYTDTSKTHCCSWTPLDGSDLGDLECDDADTFLKEVEKRALEFERHMDTALPQMTEMDDIIRTVWGADQWKSRAQTVCVCVCVCVKERERERRRARESERERERERER